MQKTKIYLAADHAGFEAKDMLVVYLKEKGYEVVDLGTHAKDSVDYPDYAQKLAKAMKDDPESRGILVCGSGVGMSIAANRFPHIRAALVSEPVSATLTRKHNNANVLCMGSRIIGSEMQKSCVDAFLNTPFEGGRHEVRVQKMNASSTEQGA